MARNSDPVSARPSVFLRSALPLAVLCVWTMMTVVAIFTDTGEELYPPKSLEGWSWFVGISLSVLCLIHGLRKRPINLKLATATVTFSILIGGICSMMTLGILLRIREAVVFRGDHLETYESNVRVWSASIHHGRGGPGYRVVLRDYPGMFGVPASDYLSAFGPMERIHPDGYCVMITVQRAGKAVRIIADRGMRLAEGSLQRCPASVG